MRIAILFFGRLKHYDTHYANITEILRDNQIDFFHSSDDSEKMTDISGFIKLYRPKGHVNTKIEYDFDLKNHKGKCGRSDANKMVRHFYNKHRVFKLCENYMKTHNFKYDILISRRFDFITDAMIDVSIVDLLDDNKIYIPLGYDSSGINDRMAMGTVESMKKYSNLFNNMIYLLDSDKSRQDPEDLTLANIVYYNMSTVRFILNCNIIR